MEQLKIQDEYVIANITEIAKVNQVKSKGTNQKRRKNNKCKTTDHLCSFIKKGESCPYGDTCRFDHDMSKALETKVNNLPGSCYNYDISGHCKMGLMCRYSKNHTSENGENLIDNERLTKYKPEINELDKDVQKLLRKRSYNFEKSSKLINDLEINSDIQLADKRSSILVDNDNYFLNKGQNFVDLKGKLILAPLTTVGNLPFRRICVEYGADVTVSEMAMSSKLLEGIKGEWALLKRHPTEKVFGIQICGSKVDILTNTAQMISENCQYDFIDINCGCPLDDICYRGKGGCAMIKNAGSRQRLLKSVRCISYGLGIPVTVKTRIGYNREDKVAHTLVPELIENGASAVCIHGRTREQRYTRTADWDYIETCRSSAQNDKREISLIGNGDILSINDYKEAVKKCDSVMIGRGALIKPWIFQEIKQNKPIDISSKERFEMLQRYVNYGLEHWGSDHKGVETTRRFLLEWLSFLHRYVPIGLLSPGATQMINQKSPNYRGRDEMETLMASHNCEDWVRISEMLLGPIPPDYTFIPKHKANSFSAVKTDVNTVVNDDDDDKKVV